MLYIDYIRFIVMIFADTKKYNRPGFYTHYIIVMLSAVHC